VKSVGANGWTSADLKYHQGTLDLVALETVDLLGDKIRHIQVKTKLLQSQNPRNIILTRSKIKTYALLQLYSKHVVNVG